MVHNKFKSMKKGVILLAAIVIISSIFITAYAQDQQATGLYIKGIDVSHYQNDEGPIDWSEISNSDIKFAFIKASEGDHVEPVILDDYFIDNMEDGSAAGLLMGAYHIVWPNYNDAVDEAQFFIDTAGDYLKPGYLRPALDLEQDTVNIIIGERGLTEGKQYLSNWVDVWMSTVKEATGIEPIIYVSQYTAINYLDTSISQYDLWIAKYTSDLNTPPNTGIWDDWAFWQHSNTGIVGGITGSVDLDLFNGDWSDLQNYVIPSSSDSLILQKPFDAAYSGNFTKSIGPLASSAKSEVNRYTGWGESESKVTAWIAAGTASASHSFKKGFTAPSTGEYQVTWDIDLTAIGDMKRFDITSVLSGVRTHGWIILTLVDSTTNEVVGQEQYPIFSYEDPEHNILVEFLKGRGLSIIEDLIIDEIIGEVLPELTPFIGPAIKIIKTGAALSSIADDANYAIYNEPREFSLSAPIVSGRDYDCILTVETEVWAGALGVGTAGGYSYLSTIINEIVVQPTEKNPSIITATLKPYSITLGEETEVSGIIQSSTSGDLSGLVIYEYSLDKSTWYYLASESSDSSGQFDSYKVEPSSTGSYYIRTTWNGNNYFRGYKSDYVTLTVTEPSNNLPISEKKIITINDPLPWFENDTITGHDFWWNHTFDGHSYISTYIGGPNSYAYFKPYLSSSGVYEVWIEYFACPDTSTNVMFTVNSAEGGNEISVDQFSSVNQWKREKLGEWTFNAGEETYVWLID